MYFTSISLVKVSVQNELYCSGHSMDINYLETPVQKITFSNVSLIPNNVLLPYLVKKIFINLFIYLLAL